MTANTLLKFSLSTLLIALVLFPASFLLAQESNPEVADIVEAEIVDGENVAAEEVEVVPVAAPLRNDWYRVERLEGDITQGDFVVGPGRAEIVVKPGETVIFEISLTNRISDGRVFDLTVEDMAGSDNVDQPVILLGDTRGPYTVKDYISFPENSLTLGLGDRARIPVKISIPKDAEPGGLYGGVLISTVRTSDVEADSQVPRSPIIARIGTLFFVTIPGEVETGGLTKSLTQPFNKSWYEKGPVKFNVLFENTGSIHLNPYGEIRINNLFGEEVGFIELEPWFVLPKSIRSRDVSWDRELLFGRYTATAFVNRGYDDVVDEVTTVFWVIPWKIVVVVFVVIFAFLFLIRALFSKFEFKRK